MINKYELLKDDGIKLEGRTLYRIKYLINIDRYNVKVGDLGGYLESEDNLSHKGDCVVLNNAKVFGNARIDGNTWVCGNVCIWENVHIDGNARITGDVCITGGAYITGDAYIYDIDSLIKYLNNQKVNNDIKTKEIDFYNYSCSINTLIKD